MVKDWWSCATKKKKKRIGGLMFMFRDLLYSNYLKSYKFLMSGSRSGTNWFLGVWNITEPVCLWTVEIEVLDRAEE